MGCSPLNCESELDVLPGLRDRILDRWIVADLYHRSIRFMK